MPPVTSSLLTSNPSPLTAANHALIATAVSAVKAAAVPRAVPAVTDAHNIMNNFHVRPMRYSNENPVFNNFHPLMKTESSK